MMSYMDRNKFVAKRTRLQPFVMKNKYHMSEITNALVSDG